MGKICFISAKAGGSCQDPCELPYMIHAALWAQRELV